MSEAPDPQWVTPEHLRSAGWSRAQMRAALGSGDFAQGVRGLWLPTDAAEDLYARRRDPQLPKRHQPADR